MTTTPNQPNYPDQINGAKTMSKTSTIDFKQATELLEMFGGEPAEISLLEGLGHSGEGLYASYTDMPEEGSEFLGLHDDEAVPAAPSQEHATQLAGGAQTPERQRMTAGRVSFFMERFLREEKLLGPNEQAALHFVIDMLAAPAQEAAPALEAPAALLTKPARVGGGSFGVGVPERCVIDAAQRQYEIQGEREAMVPEQFADEERKRRALWEMVHGPLAAAPQAPAAPVGEAQIAEVMELVKEWSQCDLIAVEAGIDTLSDEHSEKEAQEARRLDGEAQAAYRAIEAAMRNLLAAAPAAPAVDAREVGDDKALLDFLRESYCDLRSIDVPTGGDDSDVHWRVIEHHMGEPREREIGRSWSDDPREAIRAAIAAQAKGGA